MRTTTSRLFTLFAICAGISLSFVASLDAGIPIKLDHYTFHNLSATLTSGDVTLRDQFGGISGSFEGPVALGIPTLKWFNPTDDPVLINPLAHFTLYRLEAPEPGRSVVVSNQFGEQQLEVGDAFGFFTPALKNPMPGEPTPDEVNHFRCYQVNNTSAPLRDVEIENQLGVQTMQTALPSLFCNPAEKILPDGQVFPIVNSEDHLVCYQALDSWSDEVSISFLDQFLASTGVLDRNVGLLCLPSSKTGVVQTKESTWGRVKSIYR